MNTKKVVATIDDGPGKFFEMVIVPLEQTEEEEILQFSKEKMESAISFFEPNELEQLRLFEKVSYVLSDVSAYEMEEALREEEKNKESDNKLTESLIEIVSLMEKLISFQSSQPKKTTNPFFPVIPMNNPFLS